MDTSIVTFNHTRQQFVKKLFGALQSKCLNGVLLAVVKKWLQMKKIWRGGAYLEGHSQSFFRHYVGI